MFRKLTARWSENWAAITVDSLLDRMTLKGFACADESVQADLDAWWDAQDVAADAEEVHKAVAVCAEGFYLAEESDEGPLSFANEPQVCAVLYREDNPKVVEFAAKWWSEGQLTRLTLYYPDRFAHYVAKRERSKITTADVFEPDPDTPEEPNPYGRIPVFHFRRDRRQKSRLADVVPLNNALNKLFADMMVSAEFAAFRQRYIIANAEHDVSNLTSAPNELWHLPASDGEEQPVQVGEFSATDLANFIAGLDHIASRIAVLTHTPKHYLLQQGDVSGEALIAMEAPLVREATAYMQRLSVTWKHVAAFVMQLAGHSVTADDIECVWEDEHTVQPYTAALIHKTDADAGVPIVTQLRREGWSEEELGQLAADEDATEARRSSMADVALESARRRFDSGEGSAPYPPAEA